MGSRAQGCGERYQELNSCVAAMTLSKATKQLNRRLPKYYQQSCVEMLNVNI